MVILPLTNNAEESFSITIFGTAYNLRQLWNTLGFWTIDVLDENGAAIILGVKIVTKTNILAQYPEVPFDLRSESAADPVRDGLDEFNLVVTEKDA